MLYIGIGSMAYFDFMDWLGYHLGMVAGFCAAAHLFGFYFICIRCVWIILKLLDFKKIKNKKRDKVCIHHVHHIYFKTI